LTLPGSFLNCSTTSFIVFSGDSAGSTKTLSSRVMRASGVTCDSDTGDLLVMMPPSITAPIIIIALASPLLALANCASPMVPAAPPLLSKLTVAAAPASCIALPSARAVVSQPPPGLAGIIIFTLPACARAASGRPAPATSAARVFRKSSLRMVVSAWRESKLRCSLGSLSIGCPPH
jgi:hypothetical protein